MKATSKIILDTVRKKVSGKYPVKIRVTYQRFPKVFGLGIDMTQDEFDVYHSSKKLKTQFETITFFLKKVDTIIDGLKDNFTWASFETSFFNKVEKEKKDTADILSATLAYNKLLIKEERFQSAGTYMAMCNTLKEYIGGESLSFTDVTTDFLKKFDKYMRKDLSTSTVGIYMRNLRAIYNQAIAKKDISSEIYPFGKNKYIPPTSTKAKKSLKIDEIGKIFSYHPESDAEGWGKDMWIFAYFGNGINIKDLAQLRFRNIVFDEIEFLRSKTRNATSENEKKITITLNDEMKAIIKKWGNKQTDPNNYIFKILSKQDSAKQNYRNINEAIKQINKHLKNIATKLDLERVPTTNFARHSYATVLKRAGVSIEMISEQLGHTSIKTTEIYLGSFETDQRKEAAKFLTAFKKYGE